MVSVDIHIHFRRHLQISVWRSCQKDSRTIDTWLSVTFVWKKNIITRA